MNTMETKKCSKCKKVKPLSEFWKDKKTKDGCQAWCKICAAKQSTQWREDNLDRARTFNRNWRKNNLDKARAITKKWQEDNPDKARVSIKKWRKNNPEKVSEYRRRHRALLVNAEINDLTAEDWVEILTLYGHRCAYCGATGNLEADHIIPLSKGGQHTKSNIAPACKHCNCMKGTRTPRETGFDSFVNLCREV